MARLMEYAWLLPYVGGGLAVVCGAGMCYVFTIIGGLLYREWLAHRSGVHPAWGPRRLALLVLTVVAVVFFKCGDTIHASEAAALGFIMALPTVLDTGVIFWRSLEGAVYRARRKVHNPLLGVYENFYATHDRDKFPPPRITQTYCWVVPTQPLLDLIAAHGPIVEVGAGTGYVAWLLRQMGVNLIACDSMPGPCVGNRHHFLKFSWTRVRKGDAASSAAKHSDRALLLCWPPSGIDMSSRALAAYKGDTVIYIGAKDTDCGADTGDEAFHTALATGWSLETELPLQGWTQRYKDFARVYRRLPSAT